MSIVEINLMVREEGTVAEPDYTVEALRQELEKSSEGLELVVEEVLDEAHRIVEAQFSVLGEVQDPELAFVETATAFADWMNTTGIGLDILDCRLDIDRSCRPEDRTEEVNAITHIVTGDIDPEAII